MINIHMLHWLFLVFCIDQFLVFQKIICFHFCWLRYSYFRASNWMRITEIILAVILITSRYENQFLSLSHTVNTAVSIFFWFLKTERKLSPWLTKTIFKLPFCFVTPQTWNPTYFALLILIFPFLMQLWRKSLKLRKDSNSPKHSSSFLV